MTSWNLVYHILRANFDGNKSGYVDFSTIKEPEGTGEAIYEYGRKVTGYKVSDDQVTVFAETSRDGEPLREKVEITGDLLIAADGPSSAIRGMLEPEAQRKYTGYVAWRGTVPEAELPEEVKRDMSGQFTFYHTTGTQLLAYLIPGVNGSMQSKLLNWVWYTNYSQEYGEFEELMTDAKGIRHHFTLQKSDMKESLWEDQKQKAEEVLPPQFVELVKRTKLPFVQAITDAGASGAVWESGKVVLIGDALAGLRPHTASGTSQAASHALGLGQLFGEGGKQFEGLKEWEEDAMEFAVHVSKSGREMGDASQFGGKGNQEISLGKGISH
ncbi:hypothetical protein ABW20_dc0105132 [Dactylellina cionopaga]|nr:hypothetical protein ABW20_dc0105132 [Dactylellina cionopaga]